MTHNFYRRLRNYYLACRHGDPAMNLNGTSVWRAMRFALRMAASEPPR